MACILNRLRIFTCIATCLAFMVPAQKAYAQIAIIDTSDYLPLVFSGALEYNMMTAADKGYDGEVKRMLNMGAEVNIHTTEGYTALTYAIAKFRLGVVETLLAGNADPNFINAFQESQLCIAVKSLDSELADHYRDSGVNIDSIGLLIIEKLIRFGADLNFQDKDGATVLNYAAIHGHFAVADLLLLYGAETERQAWDGTTPLMAAIWAGYANIADLLAQNGANLEARDAKGFTPFLIAAQNGDTLIFRLLADQGVNMYEMNDDNWDALDIAIRAGQKEAIEWLLKYGDKWNDPENKATNYYNVAANYRKDDLFPLLRAHNLNKDYKFHFNQIDISVSGKIAFWDSYTGFSLGLKEPKSDLGIVVGFDTKLWPTRILISGSEPHVYYQYFDKSSFAWVGVYKDFSLTDYMFRNNFSFSASLNGGYFFGNKYKGTDISPESKFKISPGISIKVEKRNRVFFTGLELMTTGHSRMTPIWLRFGYSAKIYFDSSRSEGKNIKWY